MFTEWEAYKFLLFKSDSHPRDDRDCLNFTGFEQGNYHNLNDGVKYKDIPAVVPHFIGREA